MLKKLLLVLPLVAIFFTSCSDDDDYTVFTIYPQSNVTFEYNIDTVSFAVYGENENWMLTIGGGDYSDYFSFDPDVISHTYTGQGETDSIYVYSRANIYRYDIKDSITLTDLGGYYSDIQFAVKIEGIPITLEVEDTLVYVPANENILVLELENNVDNIEITCESDWFTYEYDLANQTLTFNFEENTSMSRRKADFYAYGTWNDSSSDYDTEIELNIYITQDGITSMADDSLALVQLNTMYNLGWNTGEKLDKWSGITVNNITSSVGLNRRVIELNLADKGLTGTLPEIISNLTYLQTLRLNGNDFDGEIPSSYFTLYDLELLWLGDNGNLSGILSEDFANFTKMRNLSIINTSISGEIPNAIAEYENLTSLQLRNNCLTGTFPEAFGDNNYLATLILSYNYLTGDIPDSYKNNYYWYYWEADVNLIPQKTAE